MAVPGSEELFIDGNEKIIFSYPTFILENIEKVLNKVGPKKFYSSPEEYVKKARESFAEFFFALTLKKETGLDWLVMQPNDQFPDFFMMTAKEDPVIITLDGFELVEIPPRCKDFDNAYAIIQSKINKGYPPNYHLLIFINHKKSLEWLDLLSENLTDKGPFKSIWSLPLRFRNDTEVAGSIACRLLPPPHRSVRIDMNDSSLYKTIFLEKIMERVSESGRTWYQFKDEFMRELKVLMRTTLIAQDRIKRENRARNNKEW